MLRYSSIKSGSEELQEKVRLSIIAKLRDKGYWLLHMQSHKAKWWQIE